MQEYTETDETGEYLDIHKELKLSDREYVCPVCGHMMDRDHQAAVNIDQEGLRIYKEKHCA